MRVHELLDVVAPVLGERPMVTDTEGSLTALELVEGAGNVGAWVRSQPVGRLVLVDMNSRAVPLCLYGAAAGEVPFVPINYRLADERLRSLVGRNSPCVVVAGPGVAERLGAIPGVRVVDRDLLLAVAKGEEAADRRGSQDSVSQDSVSQNANLIDAAVMLFTSGTTGEPKAAILGHDNLTSYVLSTVEFAAAAETDAGLVTVPPYHIAGISAALTALFGGRRTVYLETFDPEKWVRTAADEAATHAMVVPTMLGRILNEMESQEEGLPTLRALAYGGGPMPVEVIERALRLLPEVGFVNAYGLTETSSTVSLLGPEDHRAAMTSSDPAIRRRLGSVGQPLPTVELTVRDPLGAELGPGQRGEIWVRGDQVSGKYAGIVGSDDGWFHTRDAGEIDGDGYLYLHGRLDDVIVRGGENLSPGEIEAVLKSHPAVQECAVVGIPSVEWGESVAAVVVLAPGPTTGNDQKEDHLEEELKEFVRSTLRSTQTPETIRFRSELPMNETGKLLRRVLRDELAG